MCDYDDHQSIVVVILAVLRVTYVIVIIMTVNGYFRASLAVPHLTKVPVARAHSKLSTCFR